MMNKFHELLREIDYQSLEARRIFLHISKVFEKGMASRMTL